MEDFYKDFLRSSGDLNKTMIPRNNNKLRSSKNKMTRMIPENKKTDSSIFVCPLLISIYQQTELFQLYKKR